MKKVLIKGLLIALVAMNVSCSSNTPEKVAVAFFTHMFDGDFEGAKEYATTNTKSFLTMLGSFGAGDQLEDKFNKATFKVLETTYEGDDKAMCKLQVTGDDDEVDIQKVNLVKKDGKWLVVMGKEDGPDKENSKDDNSDS